MAGIPDEFIEELKIKVDIIEVIADYLELKRTGKNYKGLCPFHHEKTPSFSVNPDKQFYYCFGCGAGGNVFNFLMEIEHITFRESVRILAGRVGMNMPEASPFQQKINAERERLFEINYLAAKFYHYLLLEDSIGQKAVDYLDNRGLNSEDLERFQLGYAPPGWRGLFNFLTGKGYTEEELIKAGVILSGRSNNYYDRFRDRIIFPIFNLRGEVLGFGGRIINKGDSSSPKYLNSPDTLIYNKGDNLYGLNWARSEIRERKSAIIMEGYTDVIRAQKAGIGNSLASLGTALTAEQAKLLKRYAEVVYIAYDADTAGNRATLRGLDILRENGLSVRVISLPEGTDPDQFIEEQGSEAFRILEKEAKGLLDFKIEQIIGKRDFSVSEEKVRASREIIQLLAGIQDEIEREIYLKKVSRRLELDYQLLKRETARATSRDSKNKDKNYQNRYTKKDNETNISHNINKVEGNFLKAYLDNPDFRKNMEERIDTRFFSRGAKELFNLLKREGEEDPEKLSREIEDQDLRQIFMTLLVSERRELRREKVEILINRLIYLFKSRIYRKLQEETLNLNSLNYLLLKFQYLSETRGKEGF